MEEGKRFSFIYIEKGTPSRDSKRFRNRLSAFYWDHINNTHKERIVSVIQKELGVDVPFVGIGYRVDVFFKNCELRDLLDSITIIYSLLVETNYRNLSNEWMQFVQRALSEENLGYRLDAKGGVHFFVDEEFDRGRLATISCMSQEKFSAALAAFESAFKALDRSPPDTVSAVRSLFESTEIIYKLVFDSAGKSRLNSQVIQKEIKPAFQQKFHDNHVAIKAMDHLLDGFCDWTEAAHMYRHGQKVEEPQPPTMDFVVAFFSQGASLIRLLISLT